MSRAYVPPHLRGKVQKCRFGQKPRNEQKKRIKPCNNKLGDPIKQVPNIPFNKRFSCMFSSSEKHTTTKKKQKTFFGIDGAHSGCIVLYSQKHDRIFLMGSDENTICMTINPQTREGHKLVDLPYFRDTNDPKSILTPTSAWFDEHENFIFVLSYLWLTKKNHNGRRVAKIIKYDILKNRIVDNVILNFGKDDWLCDVIPCSYTLKNRSYTDLLVVAMEDHSESEDWLRKVILRNYGFNVSTDGKMEINERYTDELQDTGYQYGAVYSRRTKKMYYFGWEICEKDRFGIMTMDISKMEDGWSRSLAPEIKYLENFRYYGFCMVDERYCVFVGGKRQGYVSRESVVWDHIYIYDVVLNTWEKSPISLREPLCKVGCIYDTKRRILHCIGGSRQERCGGYNTYDNVKFYQKFSIRDVIPGFTDFKLTKNVLNCWFEGSQDKVFGRWNHDITNLIYNYI